MNSKTSLQGQLINTTGCLLCLFTALKSGFLGQFVILTVVVPSDSIQAASYVTAAPTVIPQRNACVFLYFKYFLLSFFFITSHIAALLTNVIAHCIFSL